MMHVKPRRQTMALLLVVMMALLTACGGGGTEEPALPTRVTLAETTAPPPVPQAEATLDITPSLPTGVPPPVALLESTAEATALAAPPLLGESTPQVQGEIVPSPGAIADFGTVNEGEEVLLIGTLLLEGAGNTQLTVLQDETENQLLLLLPPGMAGPLENQVVEVFGEVVAPEDGEERRGVRVISFRPAMVAGQTAALGLPPGFNPEATAPVPSGFPLPEGTAGALPPNFPPAEGTAPALPPGFPPEGTAEAGVQGGPPFGVPGALPGEVLDIELEAELTALQAYDALLEALGDDVGERVWTMVTGSAETGWAFEFYQESDQTSVNYTVSPEGEVRVTPPFNAVPLPGLEITPIDRERVVVDSDAAVGSTEPTSGPPMSAPALVLRANGERIEWTVMRITPVVIDATQPIATQATATPRP